MPLLLKDRDSDKDSWIPVGFLRRVYSTYTQTNLEALVGSGIIQLQVSWSLALNNSLSW